MSAKMGFECAVCAKLVADHERLKENNKIARRHLQEAGARRMPLVEYGVLLAVSNEARIKVEASRVELDRHKRTHIPGNINPVFIF